PEPILRSVLLPQPLGPINETTSRSRTEKLTPRTAVSTPRPPVAAKRIVTLRYSRRTTSDMGRSIAKARCLGRFRAYRPLALSSIVANAGIADRQGHRNILLLRLPRTGRSYACSSVRAECACVACRLQQGLCCVLAF